MFQEIQDPKPLSRKERYPTYIRPYVICRVVCPVGMYICTRDTCISSCNMLCGTDISLYRGHALRSVEENSKLPLE